MFNPIDNNLFPENCTVIEVADNRFVYPIFKNGSTALREYAQRNRCKVLLNNQIKNISEVEVFVRDPLTRFVSGANTVVEFVMRDNTNLDRTTVKFFVKNFLFLNSHFSPQIYWLINLARFGNEHLKLTFKDSQDVRLILAEEWAPLITQKVFTVEEIQNDPIIKGYIELDSVLVASIGQTLTFSELINKIRLQAPTMYTTIFDRAKNIINALP